MKILIAGAGVGGLSAALSLHAAGFTEVQVMEAADELRPEGVGLNILPNAIRELSELGVYEQLSVQAVTTSELALYNFRGQLIWKEPRGRSAGYHWPQLSIHRGHLLSVLAAAVRRQLGHDTIVAHTRVTGWSEQPDGRITVTLLSGGDTTATVADVDLLIGADGIHSTVRSRLYPDEGPAPGNGMVMWRGTTWAPAFLDGSTMIVAGTDQERLVLYPIATEPDHGRSLINWVAARPDPRGGDSDWTRKASVDDVLKYFGGILFEWLDVPTILSSTSQVYRYPLVDRDPLPRWSFGRVTLLGDAAHAMYPMGSNGATQSIIDARALAQALALAGPDVPQALQNYQNERLPVMTRLQAINREQGPEAVISTVHRRAPNGFQNLHDVISQAELESVSSGYAGAGSFDVTTVNTRPSRTIRPSGPQQTRVDSPDDLTKVTQ